MSDSDNKDKSGFRKKNADVPGTRGQGSNPRIPGTQARDVTDSGSKKLPSSSKESSLIDKAGSDVAFKQGAKLKEGPGSPVQQEHLKEGSSYPTNKVKENMQLNKDAMFSRRFRIPRKLEALYNNDPEKLKKLSEWFFRQLDGQSRDREDYLTLRLPAFRNTVLNFVSAGLQEVFEGSHNIHVPLAFEKCKAMHARIYQAVFGMDPMFSLKPRTNVASAKKDAKEDLLNFILKSYINNRQGIYSVIDQDIWNFVSDGTSITRHSWLKDVRKFVDIEDRINDKGEEVEVDVEREEIVFDGPCLATRPIENIYMIGDKMDDADSLDIIADRQRYTKSDLVKETRLGFFHKETVREILEEVQPTTFDNTYQRQDDIYKFEKEVTTGMRQLQKESGIKAYNIFEACLRFDIDDDGTDEELVVWIEESSRKVLRITYLDRVGPGGKRPFVIKRAFPREGTPYGLGFGEMLYGLNNEIDYLHNMRLDAAVFQVLPFFVYRSSSSLGEQKLNLNIGPGKGIKVDDVNDIAFPRPNTNLQYTFQEEENVRGIADRVSSVSDLSMGQVSGQGATRTATGTAALVAAGDALLDIYIKRYQQGFTKNLEIIDKQVVELLPLGTQVRVLGVDGIEQFKVFKDREALRFDSDFELQANSANSNKAIERELAATTFQNSLNPILIQTGVVGPDQIKNSYVRYLKSLEVKNIHDYVANFDDSMSLPTYSGKDELSMILFGMKPPVNLNDKHAEKLAFFEQFEASPDFGAFDTDEQLQIYFETKQAHQNALAAMQAQANAVAQSGITAPMQTAGIAAGAGAPNGVAQQQSDLMGNGFGAQGAQVPQ